MNALALNSAITMSSLEIAELVGKRHDNVRRTVESLLEKNVIQLPQLEEVINHLGQSVTQYRVGKRDSYIIVAQLSPKFTAKLVDRWQELEAGQVPKTLSGALRLAADQAEQIERQQAALAIAAPKVEFVDRYVDASGLKGFREVCKLLGANENRFREFLLDRQIMYRLAGKLMPMAQHMNAGRFEVKTGTADNGRSFNEAKYTAKGVNWIAGEWAKYQLGVQQ